MGFRVAAIARGRDKKELALKLGAHHYIDSTASDPAQALQELGGAKVVLATAGSGASMSPLIRGLAVRGQLVVVGEALEVPPQRPHHPNLPTVLNVPMGGFNLVAS
ncbi:zinc-binding dehydrogenase [Streptomyces rochei]|uniref:zinc-binding dehydrogenase n=1 Tax=Streptomyces rochei TaxID=1928 RepID=UPI0036A3511B